MSAVGSKQTAEVVVLAHQDLSGKVVIVTGGNTGIGLETVKTLANAGAHVWMTTRNVEAGNKALDAILSPDMKGKVTVHALDLADFESIKAFADTVTAVNVLICNAGVAACPLTRTKQGFEQQIGVNHIGHFYLTKLLLPKLNSSGCASMPSRIVIVASLNYLTGSIDLDDLNFEKRKYHPIKAYSDSKLANMLFARELAQRMKSENVSVISLHPGLVNTSLTRHMGWLGSITRFFAKIFGKTIPQGAATSIYAATAPNIQSGAYLEDCAQKEPKPKALDDEMARKLWEKTEELVEQAITGIN